MSKKITDRVEFSLNKHGDAENAAKEMVDWTAERRDFFLSKMDVMQTCLKQNNPDSYWLAFSQLREAIVNQKNTLDKLHQIILFDDE